MTVVLDQKQLPFEGEFEALTTSMIKRYHAVQLKSTQKSAHLDWEDLVQQARLGLWERRDELDGVTDRYKRGNIAMTIINDSISKMLTKNQFFRTGLATELIPIITMTEVGGDGDQSTADFADAPVEDHAPLADWNAAFAALKPRSQEVLLLRQLGWTWDEIGDHLDVASTALVNDLDRDLARHGLLEYIHEIVELKRQQKSLVFGELPTYARGDSYKRHRMSPWLANPDGFNWDETKTCQNCQVVFPRDKRDGDKRWETRQFCSHACSVSAITLDRSETKVCPNCGEEFGWPKDIRRSVWEERKFCSRACAMMARAKGERVKRCQQCGETFERDPDSSSNYQFQLRKYCSTACSNIARSRAASRLPELEARTCEECGEEYQPTRNHQRFCSPLCRNREGYRRRDKVAYEPRICAASDCDVEFTPQRKDRIYCTHECGNRERARQATTSAAQTTPKRRNDDS